MAAKSRPVARLALAAGLVVLAACEASESPSPSGTPAASVSTEPSAEPTSSAYAGLWTDATAETIGETAEWTNKVEVADLNGDHNLDLLFPNGGDYETPGEAIATRVFFNSAAGDGQFTEVTDSVVGDLVGFARVAKVADLNEDGNVDIVLGTTYQTQSQLLLGTGDGAFTNATAQLPQVALSIGDADIGDVDGDGDLDLVLADWGPGSPMANDGGQVQLWLNDGAGSFTDATAAQMPSTAVNFSWELELVDVDNDWDLDLAVSAKMSPTSFLYENTGSGAFTDVTEERLPAFTNNYDFEAMDLDGDGYLDLVTINDGDNPTGEGGREHVFRNDGEGGFDDVTAEWWPNEANPGEDDNNIAFLDVDSDGDADFLVGSLTGPDRLMINDGTGHLAIELAAFDSAVTPGTLGMTVADLNADGRLDVVEAQGENPQAEAERVYFATDALAPDTAPPIVDTDLTTSSTGSVTVHARVHDSQVYRPGDIASVEVRWEGGSAPLAWFGEFLFRGPVEIPAGATGLEVCAIDRAGNEACAP